MNTKIPFDADESCIAVLFGCISLVRHIQCASIMSLSDYRIETLCSCYQQVTAKVQFLGRDQTRYLQPSKIIDGNIMEYYLIWIIAAIKN